ncbi:hypothetical protein [Arenimonas fontis]|uniref:Uncharacterized protein n=1 Tax=Arenimonas fontis TaxID=2608255 RepID=A0A5B2ZBT2_9GAMM|nr:hypothetical protein [Arenimonas fontis]KAA2284740.1 hypothetical protein F0415_08575 [Arenimonas fontis]
MNLRNPLRRGLFALPLVALALVAAIAAEPPELGERIQRGLAARLAGECDVPAPGLLGLARVPGHLVLPPADCAG